MHFRETMAWKLQENSIVNSVLICMYQVKVSLWFRNSQAAWVRPELPVSTFKFSLKVVFSDSFFIRRGKCVHDGFINAINARMSKNPKGRNALTVTQRAG